MIQYCEYCDKQIDLDYDSEHFDDLGRCVKGVEWANEQLKELNIELNDLMNDNNKGHEGIKT